MTDVNIERSEGLKIDAMKDIHSKILWNAEKKGGSASDKSDRNGCDNSIRA